MAAFEAAQRANWARHFLMPLPLTGRLSEQVGERRRRTETPLDSSFARMKRLTIFGYYTSEIGLLKELGYKGNQALPEFPGCKADG